MSLGDSQYQSQWHVTLVRETQMTSVLGFVSSSARKQPKKAEYSDSIRKSTVYSICSVYSQSFFSTKVLSTWHPSEPSCSAVRGPVTLLCLKLGLQKPPSNGSYSSGKWCCCRNGKKKCKSFQAGGKNSQLLIACLCSYVTLPVCIAFCSALIIISSIAPQQRNTTVAIRN